MKIFSDRLIGKSVEKIEAAELHDSIFVVLSDRSAFTVYTEVSATLSCYQAQQIERVTNASDQIVLHLSGNASVTISTDRQRFPTWLNSSSTMMTMAMW